MPPYYHQQPPVQDLFGQGPVPDRPVRRSRKKGLVKKIRYALSLFPAF